MDILGGSEEMEGVLWSDKFGGPNKPQLEYRLWGAHHAPASQPSCLSLMMTPGEALLKAHFTDEEHGAQAGGVPVTGRGLTAMTAAAPGHPKQCPSGEGHLDARRTSFSRSCSGSHSATRFCS